MKCGPPPGQTSATWPPGTTPRILCVMQLHNEARYLEGCLAHLRGHVDGVIALDDGSTDGTGALLTQHPLVDVYKRQTSAYVDQYDPSLLFPIPRAGKRAEIGITGASPFFGADLWTAFELSWLNPVSYTHLDVYKRQSWDWACSWWPGP